MNGDGFKLEIRSRSENESFARAMRWGFTARLDPTLDEISGHQGGDFRGCNQCGGSRGTAEKDSAIVVSGSIEGRRVTFSRGQGVGIDDIEQARRPFLPPARGRTEAAWALP